MLDKTPSERLHYIDSLRVIAILMMFIYHVSMIFVAEWGWHIKNSGQSNVLMEFNYWMAFFRMPLLFLVSGFISYTMINRMNWNNFVRLRFMRLIIPTVIWTFLLVAPQIYFERKLQGSELSYFEFYQLFLQFKWWPEGNFHWLHLWFIPYLFVYNIISIPICLLLNRKNLFVNKIEQCILKPYSLYLFVLIAIIPYTFLSVHYPTTHDFIHDYARHSFFIFFILAGLLFFRFQQLLAMLETRRHTFFRLAFLSILIINALRWNGLEPFQLWSNWKDMPQTYMYIALLNFNSWMWVFVCVGYARKYLNKTSKLLTYSNRAVYPFYILHQTVIVIIAYYVVQTPDEAAFKYVFLLVTCFSICLIIYHLFILPFKFVRFTFGIK